MCQFKTRLWSSSSANDCLRAEHAEQAAHIQRLNDKRDLKGSAKFFLSGFGLSEDELEAILQSPAGAAMIEAPERCHTITPCWTTDWCGQPLAATVLASSLVLASRAMPEAALQLVDAMPNARFAAMDAPTHELPPGDIVPLLISFLAG